MTQSTLGDRLAAYRKLAGISAQALADAAGAGMSRAVVTNIETNRKTDVTVSQLMALANALSMPPMALMVDLTNPDGPSDIEPVAETLTNFDLPSWIVGEHIIVRDSDQIAFENDAQRHATARLSGWKRLRVAEFRAHRTQRSIDRLRRRRNDRGELLVAGETLPEGLEALRKEHDELLSEIVELRADLARWGVEFDG